MSARAPRPAANASPAREHFARWRGARAHHLAQLCLTSAAFVDSCGPRCFAQSQVDYARGVLGARPAQFKRWIRVGRLLESSLLLRRGFEAGHLSFAACDLLARSGRPLSWIEASLAQIEGLNLRQLAVVSSSESEAVPGHADSRVTEVHSTDAPEELHRLRLRMPAAAAAYVDDTLRLGRALLGAELPDDACFEAIVAEASTEIETSTSRDAARQRLSAHWSHTRSLGPSIGEPELAQGGAAKREPTARATSTPRDDAAWKRRCHRLHRILARRLDRWRNHEANRDDQLLDLLHAGAHTRWGFARFQDFAEAVLDLPASTAWDRIRRARRLRQSDPLTRARIDGRIGAVPYDLLERLHRRVRVPLSDLEPWIEFAASHTTAALRDACSWAAAEAATDQRRWSLDGHPPPSELQLRTLNSSLETLLATAADPATWIARAQDSVWVERSWLLQADLLDLLLQQMVELDPRRPWLALCRICALARESWAQHVELHLLPSRRRRVLERDGWRCRAPECSRRRNLQVHHIHYRSRGGIDDESNLVTLCAFHHLAGEHAGLLRVRGRAGEDIDELRWEMGLDERGVPARIYTGDRRMDPRPDEEKTPDRYRNRGWMKGKLCPHRAA